MRILVTGAAGYKGSVLVPKLLSLGHDVTALDAMWFGAKGLQNDFCAEMIRKRQLRILPADIRTCDLSFLREIDIIIHLASVANDPCANLNPALTWEVIAGGSQRLAAAAAAAAVQHFIFASSASVYGISDREHVTEDTPCVPLTVYNQSKLVAERAVASYRNKMDVTIVRPATVCGLSPRMRLDVVVNMLTMQALNRGKITVLGGAQHRPNVHIEDITDLYCYLIDRPLNYAVNAGHENLTVTEIANLVAKRTGAEIEVRPSTDARSYRLDSQLVAAAGWKPTRTVAQAIDEIVMAHNSGDLIESDEMRNVDWMRREGIA